MSRILRRGNPRGIVGLLLTLALGASTGCASRGDVEQVGSTRTLPAGGRYVKTATSGGRVYVVYLPPKLDGGDSTPSPPLVLFLHGLGEAGGSPWRATDVGIGQAIDKSGGTFPAVVVFPHVGRDWRGRALDAAAEVFEHARAAYAPDTSRVILTGISTGGAGTWRLAARHPQWFDRLIVVAGYAAPADLDLLAAARIPTWVLHNRHDWVVPVANARRMVEGLLALTGEKIDVRLTEYSRSAHDAWVAAYTDPDVWAWAFDDPS